MAIPIKISAGQIIQFQAGDTVPVTYLGLASAGMCQGRLTLTTGVPITISDVTAATTLYFTPCNGNLIGLYSGSAWVMLAFAETSVSLSGLTESSNYDIFGYNNSGTFALDPPLIWTNSTTRATGLVLQNGVWVKSGATTRRYLGTIRTTATTGQTEDSSANRFVWNLYNQVERILHEYDATGIWTYASATWRPGNNNSVVMNRVNLVVGLQVSILRVTLVVCISAASGASGNIAIGEDSTSVPHALSQGDYGVYNVSGYQSARASLDTYPVPGSHYYQWLEQAYAGTVTFNGNPLPSGFNSGMTAYIKG